MKKMSSLVTDPGTQSFAFDRLNFNEWVTFMKVH